ncbi:MAG: ribonuclease [Thermosediminibacterales bacterium]|nr:ribonuclease [Thermosediminibacterales bacterium]MDK2835656.1 ribonuclease [Thermosediminibacterales bacterium]
MDTLVIHTDGASRGNPGDAGIGIVVYNEDKTKIIKELYEYIGKTTNNVAEYTALLKGLKAVEALKPKAIKIFLDSELIVKQINGEYKVRNEGLRPIYEDVKKLLRKFNYTIEHIPREQNKKADELANKGIDEKNKHSVK